MLEMMKFLSLLGPTPLQRLQGPEVLRQRLRHHGLGTVEGLRQLALPLLQHGLGGHLELQVLAMPLGPSVKGIFKQTLNGGP